MVTSRLACVWFCASACPHHRLHLVPPPLPAAAAATLQPPHMSPAWSRAPIWDTSCCYHPLTDIPYLRPGPRTPHSLASPSACPRRLTLRRASRHASPPFTFIHSTFKPACAPRPPPSPADTIPLLSRCLALPEHPPTPPPSYPRRARPPPPSPRARAACSSVPDRPHMIVVSFFWSCSTLFGRLLPNTLQTQHFISSANRGSAFGTPVGVLCS